jgi:glyoxylase-like metal-dependent hydrolase (beta-lactamase superfamily II)
MPLPRPAPYRRHAAALWFALVAMSACAAPPADEAPQRLAAGVYMLPGTGGVAEPENGGRIGNVGFIVGASGVIVVDTGTSFEHGQALLAAVRSVTDKPVLMAVVTHVRPEFLFGAGAFRAAGIPVLMHTKAARLMASRCETCLKALRQTLGEEAMRGTATFRPDQEFEDSITVDAGARPVQLIYLGHTSGPGDIAVFDSRSRTLFAGGLLEAHRVPDIQDSDFFGWLRALRQLRSLRPRYIVPGHGPDGDGIIEAIEEYLTQLQQSASFLAQTGVSLLDVPDRLQLPDFADWDQYETIHRRNAAIAFLGRERDFFFK